MRQFSPLICALIATVFPLSGRAEPPPSQPLPYLPASLSLWQATSPDSQKNLLNGFHFQSVTGETAPLARYHPTPDSQPTIEIGQNLRQYRRDYIYLVSNQDKINQPDFMQYMTVLTTLNLANETTHYLQDKNGSLKDFYTFYNTAKTDEACALYSLQQYTSDIVMMEKAIRIERYFLGQGAVKGLNALRVALEKNNLRDEFEDFREGLKNQNITQINATLHKIRSKREDANMSGLPMCRPHGDALLDQTIIDRATQPATIALSAYRAKTPRQQPKINAAQDYNN